ncbi:PD-(D/E)XK nuclease domain-containing protein [Photobacterium leiognathi]|uniref:PD-(D/E)XK nuclease domain-containing protein n=1 Tax=Photobacterium leiognathi TaxID=553611 RepID=UPI002981FB5D|nr:hypothetical protein [Photobacterium leiognathi]
MGNKQELLEYLAFANTLLDSMDTSINRESESNVWKYSSYKNYAKKYNKLASLVIPSVKSAEMLDLYNIDKIPSEFNTVASQQKTLFFSVHANLSILKAMLESQVGYKEDKVLQIRDFLEANLRRATFNEPEREVQVQDTIEQLLIGKGLEKGVDYDREVGRVKVSIKEVIPDFILQKLGLAIEVKLSKSATKSRTIVDEINADILAYSKGYRSTLFVIYDLGSIRDESEFKNDLEIHEGVSVVIVKH